MNFIPPEKVARNAREALAWREAGVRAGTPVGWARARQLAGREAVSERTLRRMVAYFARHAGDRLDRDGRDGRRPSNGWVMWQAWGGNAGREWAKGELLKRANPERIARSKPSLPARWLKEHGFVRGRVLDFGSGYGTDARTYRWNQYDPVTHPRKPKGKFDVVLVTYVLNILPPKIQKEVVKEVGRLLRIGGVSYFTVRRDVSRSSRGPRQWWVEWPVKPLRETGSYAIYCLRR